ncbi:MAG: helix-turn-helix transcriptional regulator [Candidatus Izemoplasmatales bacterium]|nr:helix-turn-helix transcriptional regulator [Candidatus Izemoplasmatales bacterium]
MKEKHQIDYGNVVINNFFIYLYRKAITQKKYAMDNNMDQSLLSKWKKGDSSPTLDQVKQAAKYFEITVNDLVYTEKEKKHLEVLSDKSYDPILAQQSIKVKLYADFFKKPAKVLIFCLLIFSLLVFMVFVLRNNSPYYSLLILMGIPFASWAIHVHSFEEKTYIINYLDDIFYRRNESTNKFYFASMIIRVTSIFTIFYYSTLLVNIESTTSIESGLLTTLVVLLMVSIFSSIVSITDLPKKFKLEIYDNEIAGYKSSKLFLLVQFSIFSISILLSIHNFTEYMLFLIVSTIILFMNAFDFSRVSFEYSKYVLVYQENDKNPRELFPSKN